MNAIKRVNEIKQKRTDHFIMERLRKGRQVEIERDVKDVQKNISLIRSPAAGLRERQNKKLAQNAAMMPEDDDSETEVGEKIEYVSARVLEKQLAEEMSDDSDDQEMIMAE